MKKRKNWRKREPLLRGETYQIWMRQSISPLVVITLAMIRSKLCSLGVEQVHKLHEEGCGRHLLRVLIEQSENIALVVRDEGQFESQHGGATAKDEEGGKNRRDPPRGVAVEESPGALLWFDLKLEPPDCTLVWGFDV